MEFLCTICSKEKRTDPARLQAIHRYLSQRIQYVEAESRRLGKPMLIFSGKFGLLHLDDEIPYYDLRLSEQMVPDMTRLLVAQMQEKSVTSMFFYGRGKTAPGWGPYSLALEQACGQLGIKLKEITCLLPD